MVLSCYFHLIKIYVFRFEKLYQSENFFLSGKHLLNAENRRKDKTIKL